MPRKNVPASHTVQLLHLTFKVNYDTKAKKAPHINYSVHIIEFIQKIIIIINKNYT